MIDSNMTKLNYLTRLKQPHPLTRAPPTYLFNEAVICSLPAHLGYEPPAGFSDGSKQGLRGGRILLLWEHLVFQDACSSEDERLHVAQARNIRSLTMEDLGGLGFAIGVGDCSGGIRVEAEDGAVWTMRFESHFQWEMLGQHLMTTITLATQREGCPTPTEEERRSVCWARPLDLVRMDRSPSMGSSDLPLNLPDKPAVQASTSPPYAESPQHAPLPEKGAAGEFVEGTES